MALFGLFDKKFCSVCGEKIGLLGNTKLKDGNLCKDCAAKLSPWFRSASASTLDQIYDQMLYRDSNKKALEEFNTSLSLGYSTKVLVDEAAWKFVCTSAGSLIAANPDILDLGDITAVKIDTDEYKNELKRKNKEGKEESYIPPRFEYRYSFYIIINVNNPYFQEMKFKIAPDVTIQGGPRINLDLESEYVQSITEANSVADTLWNLREERRAML